MVQHGNIALLNSETHNGVLKRNTKRKMGKIKWSKLIKAIKVTA